MLLFQDFDKATDLIALHYIKLSELGWQRIDLTAALHKWYSNGWNKKLRLLIDCSGCGDLVQVHLFNADNANNNNNNRKNLNVKSNHHHHHNHYNINNNNNNVYQRSLTNNDNINKNNNINKDSNQYNVANIKNAKADSLKNQHMFDNTNHYHSYSATTLKSSVSQNNLQPDLTRTIANDDINTNKETISESEVHRPFLVVHLDSHRIKRVRRRAFDCNDSIKGPCCKQRFYVSFQEIGWDDWILAPPGYYANYCRGECSGIYRTPDTFGSFHTHFIEEYRKLEKIEGLQQCCTPTKFSSMSLIYLNEDDKIIKRDLPKMVVEECGCP